ncbi:hypothetical protein [Micromonospora taraxaci]|uniref:hypothetical protein n=1 Tax=Micromonospora taraxaci TaxID=1316803 RepID=UPI0033A938BC
MAAKAYKDQVRVNEAQLESARLERQRYDERYAARVSFWHDPQPLIPEPSFPRFKIQNRSPVPVMRVHFLMSGDAAGRPMPDVAYGGWLNIPPCTVMTVQLVLIDERGDSRPPPELVVVGMRFIETVGWWHISAIDAVELAAVRAPVPLGDRRMVEYELDQHHRLAVEVRGTREAAGDCGEGS